MRTRAWMMVMGAAMLAAACGNGKGHGDGDTDADADADVDATDAATDDGGVDPGTDPDATGDPDAAGDPDGVEDAADGIDGEDADEGDGSTVARPWVMGYYVGYQRDLYPPADVRYDALTHLAVGRVAPEADGSLDTTFDIDAVSGPAMADDLTTRAHAAGIATILMVGGAGEHDGFAASCSSAGTRATLVANLVSFSAAHGFDGLDLDWEPLPADDHADFRALAEDLRTAWPGVILTIPMGYLNPSYETADAWYADIAPLFDQMNVMSYAMTGAWGGWQSWHSSALYGETPTTPTSIDSTIDLYLDAGVPAAKLGIGMGFFGVCYTPPVTGPNQDLGGSWIAGSDNSMSYTNIMEDYHADPARHWDSAARSPYLSFASATGPLGCSFVSYEDPQSIAERAAYVESMGLGGAIVWTINQGYLPSMPAGDRDPLMDALADGFGGP